MAIWRNWNTWPLQRLPLLLSTPKLLEIPYRYRSAHAHNKEIIKAIRLLLDSHSNRCCNGVPSLIAAVPCLRRQTTVVTFFRPLMEYLCSSALLLQRWVHFKLTGLF
jgi:hypothetical protein